MIQWKTLDNLSQLDQIQKDSYERIQAIFKHSTSCPLSLMAKSRIDREWKLDDVIPYYLDLKVYREISNAIATKWKVNHESPQIILIKDGEAIFDESHLDITVAAIEKVLSPADV